MGGHGRIGATERGHILEKFGKRCCTPSVRNITACSQIFVCLERHVPLL